MTANYPTKIITLWAVFLLGLLFHTQLGLMPLFHGLSIAEPNTSANAAATTDISPILWLMLAFFVLPMLAMILSLFSSSKRFKGLHFGLTVIYTLLNLGHLIADLLVSPIVWPQIALMGILFMIGIMLNLVSWQWLKASKFKTTTIHIPSQTRTSL
jgi:hypothetical protein